ncbi:MAG: adenosylhomocysteinase [Euryarchaeota archaeon]|nr:adenosylhomocysteinase [Euryarchaeota archaeon]
MEGMNRLDWAREHMPVLNIINARFQEEKPFAGLKIGMALHVEAKTGILALTLRQGGAKVRLASCNPLSTDDSVVEALRSLGMEVFAKKGESNEEYYENLHNVLEMEPDIIIDDGGDLTTLLHTDYSHIPIMGGNEETTTGVLRLKVMEQKGVLRFPMFNVNDAQMKHFFDNRYGTGQSTLNGIMTATNLTIAGKTVVVAGYGWCGRGVAMRMRGMGADVIVTEIDPVKAIEARMDGFRVMQMIDAIREADMVVTVTGMKDVVREEHLRAAKDGIILANAGHFDNEISKEALNRMAKSKRTIRRFVEEFELGDKKVYLLGDGRLINLVAGQGHPAEIMDMSFAIQALTAEYIAKNHETLERKVYPVPEEIDLRVAELKLQSMGIEIDSLNEEQRRYLEEWREGT